jgi:putative tricarboxylic transport membrane protein
MEILGLLADGFLLAMQPLNLLLIIIGVTLGLFIGAMPGLGSVNGVAILLPITFLVPPGSAIIFLAAIYYGAMYGGAISSIKLILDETGLPSRKLAIETIEFPLDLTLEMAELLDLSICFDTGHVLAGFSGQIAFEEAFHACLPRLAEIHLHDSPNFINTGNLGYGKDHQPLGSGDLDIKVFLKRLKHANFVGPIIFELTIADAQASLAYIKEHGGLA